MRCANTIAYHADGGYGEDGSYGKSRFHFVIYRHAFRQTKPPAIIVDHDRGMIRVVERSSAAIEGGIVEVPFGEASSPDELGKIMAVFFITGTAAFRREIILVPPLQPPLRATVACRILDCRSDSR